MKTKIFSILILPTLLAVSPAAAKNDYIQQGSQNISPKYLMLQEDISINKIKSVVLAGRGARAQIKARQRAKQKAAHTRQGSQNRSAILGGAYGAHISSMTQRRVAYERRNCEEKLRQRGYTEVAARQQCIRNKHDLIKAPRQYKYGAFPYKRMSKNRSIVIDKALRP